MIAGFTLSSIKAKVIGVPALEVMNNLFITFMYNFIVGIWVGMAAMFGTDLYYFIKKNLKNEWQYGW